jgi:predicted histidine transporter YuiF (NhaC family)
MNTSIIIRYIGKNKYFLGIFAGIAVMSYGLYLMRYGAQDQSISLALSGLIIAMLFAVLSARQEDRKSAKAGLKVVAVIGTVMIVLVAVYFGLIWFAVRGLH